MLDVHTKIVLLIDAYMEFLVHRNSGILQQAPDLVGQSVTHSSDILDLPSILGRDVILSQIGMGGVSSTKDFVKSHRLANASRHMRGESRCAVD